VHLCLGGNSGGDANADFWLDFDLAFPTGDSNLEAWSYFEITQISPQQ